MSKENQDLNPLEGEKQQQDNLSQQKLEAIAPLVESSRKREGLKEELSIKGTTKNALEELKKAPAANTTEAQDYIQTTLEDKKQPTSAENISTSETVRVNPSHIYEPKSHIYPSKNNPNNTQYEETNLNNLPKDLVGFTL